MVKLLNPEPLCKTSNILFFCTCRYSHIVPCGIPDKGVTSLSKELKKDVSIDDMIPTLTQKFAANFRCDIKETRLDDWCQEIVEEDRNNETNEK